MFIAMESAVYKIGIGCLGNVSDSDAKSPTLDFIIRFHVGRERSTHFDPRKVFDFPRLNPRKIFWNIGQALYTIITMLLRLHFVHRGSTVLAGTCT